MTRNSSFLLTLGLGIVIWVGLFLAIAPVAEGLSSFVVIRERIEQLFAKANTRPPEPKSAAIRAEGSPHPRLPPDLIALVNEPLSLYFDGIVSGKEPDSFLVEISSETLSGKEESRRWTLIPNERQVGNHKLHITVRDWNDAILSQQDVDLQIINPPPIPAKPIKILLVGDSLTRSTPYPQFLHEKLDSWAPGHIQWIGSQRTTAHDPKEEALATCSRHESCNGWTWKLFASHFSPGSEERYFLPRSPFVYADTEHTPPRLDVARYLQEQGCEEGIDYVIFQLGINETFGVNLRKHHALEAALDKMTSWADILIAAFRDACPKVRIGIALPIPFTRSSGSFAKTYGGKSDAWSSRQIQDRLVERMLAHFQPKGVFFIPMNITLDVLEGYSPKDAGHPNSFGAQQMAEAAYLALLGQIAKS